jgi:hypothetical protein
VFVFKAIFPFLVPYVFLVVVKNISRYVPRSLKTGFQSRGGTFAIA